jgi:hypothetical protein
MKLPHGDKAFVDEAKLRDYCLNPLHHRGRHKARRFRSLLGFTAADAPKLRQLLLTASSELEAQVAGLDEFGQRYWIDIELQGTGCRVVLCSAWIVRAGEDFPRLTSCYIR